MPALSSLSVWDSIRMQCFLQHAFARIAAEKNRERASKKKLLRFEAAWNAFE
jgi:hypothetical protein